ncbi:MAG: GxxExxY protein [Verrucomicrobiota bacterium]|jgi:hypothetical protein
MKPEIYKDEGYQFMGAAFEVYNDRGYGLAEEIYQECLEIELELRGISFRSKAEIKCFYKGRELKKRYVPDLHAHRPATRRLPRKLRPQGHTRMEAVHPLRTHRANRSRPLISED